MIDKNSCLKILIVDDSDLILNSLRKFFEGYNFKVVTCIDGLEGIQQAVEFKPDIIFLDLLMPNFDGIKMLQVKSVLQDIKEIPVIVISANTVKSNVLAAIEAGANKVISKPLKKDLLMQYMNELLNKDLFSLQELEEAEVEEDEDVRHQLAKFFVNSFPTKKNIIKEALVNRNKDSLRIAVHEIKGAGASIGYPELTSISKELEEKEISSETDWVFAELKVNQIFQKVKQIEDEINNIS